MEKDYYTPDTNPKDCKIVLFSKNIVTLELSKWINECLSLFISECWTWSSPLLKDLFEEWRTQFSSINFKLTKTKSIKGYKDILQGLNSEDVSNKLDLFNDYMFLIFNLIKINKYIKHFILNDYWTMIIVFYIIEINGK